MSEKTEEEIKEFLDSVKKGNTYTGHLDDDEIEYVENLRKEDPILDKYISALEFELKELIK